MSVVVIPERPQPEPRQVAIPSGVAGGTTIVCTFNRTPLTSSVFFISSVMVVATIRNISSISQTNVTWTSVHTNTNGTSNRTELWKGVGNGSTPGTTATITYVSTITNAAAYAMEFPGGYLAATPVQDQAADNTGSGTNQTTGTIVPTTSRNLTFVSMCIGNGTIEQKLRSPYQFTAISNIGAFFGVNGYLWGSTGSVFASCPSQTSSTWANQIVSVI